MADGSKEAGDDAVVGRTNFSNARTRVIATEHGTDPDDITPYEVDFVLEVAIENGMLSSTGHALDAIHATGTSDGGNGVVGRGMTGLVGYQNAVPRTDGPAGSKSHEKSWGAGVLGFGKSGVVGVGMNGTGVRAIASSTFAGVEALGGSADWTEAEPGGPGVNAVGGEGADALPGGPGLKAKGVTGVIAEGTNGPGVTGVGTGHKQPGVRGTGTAQATPLSPSHVVGGPGVHGIGTTGSIGVTSSPDYTSGPGVMGESDDAQGGVFQSKKKAQLWLMPLSHKDPSKLERDAEAGELLVLETKDERGKMIASLWFCTVGGPASQSKWTKIA